MQLVLVEFLIDGLRMASMNTPDMLSNSLSVVGGLILGDFAVEIGWLIPEVILYMAFVAIANWLPPPYKLVIYASLSTITCAFSKLTTEVSFLVVSSTPPM